MAMSENESQSSPKAEPMRGTHQGGTVCGTMDEAPLLGRDPRSAAWETASFKYTQRELKGLLLVLAY